MNDQQNTDGNPEQTKQVVSFLLTNVIGGWASFGGVLFRYGFGTRYFAWRGPIGCLVYLLFVSVCFSKIAHEPWVEFLVAYLICIIVHRIEANRSPQKHHTHSSAWGHSLFTQYFNWHPITAREYGEPVLVSLVSITIIAMGWPCLGLFMLGAATMGAVDANANRRAHEHVIRMMRDAELEQDNLMDEFDLHRH